MVLTKTLGLVKWEPGARFTKHLKPKVFVSPIVCMELAKILGLRCLSETGTESLWRIRMNIYFLSYNKNFTLCTALMQDRAPLNLS